ncbi:putative cupin superfamily protein [Bradyrhizobium diazoefficiens]
MPKIDIAAVPERRGSGYPSPFSLPCAERIRQRLGSAGGPFRFRRQFDAAAAGQLVEPAALAFA